MTKYVTAYFLDAKDGIPSTDAPLRHGPAVPSDALTISVVDRRQSPPLIVGQLPSDESLATGMTLIKKAEHDQMVSDVESWQADNHLRELQKRRESMVLSRFQVMAVLREFGKRGDVEQIIEQPDTDPLTVDAWNNGAEFRRLSPTILDLAPQLNLSDEDLDQMFERGAEIEA